jgi:hypothetical protein
VLGCPPVRFRRAPGMLPLPVPDRSTRCSPSSIFRTRTTLCWCRMAAARRDQQVSIAPASSKTSPTIVPVSGFGRYTSRRAIGYPSRQTMERRSFGSGGTTTPTAPADRSTRPASHPVLVQRQDPARAHWKSPSASSLRRQTYGTHGDPSWRALGR